MITNESRNDLIEDNFCQKRYFYRNHDMLENLTHEIKKTTAIRCTQETSANHFWIYTGRQVIGMVKKIGK